MFVCTVAIYSSWSSPSQPQISPQLLLVVTDLALFLPLLHYPLSKRCKTCTHPVYICLWTCKHIGSFTHLLPLLSVLFISTHTHTGRQAAMGGGNVRNAPNPGLVFWLVPDFMPSPPGSVARPPCARPTGSNTRPGQPSSSSRPIINQQAALQSISPPPPHTSKPRAPWKIRGRLYGLILQEGEKKWRYP